MSHGTELRESIIINQDKVYKMNIKEFQPRMKLIENILILTEVAKQRSSQLTTTTIEIYYIYDYDSMKIKLCKLLSINLLILHFCRARRGRFGRADRFRIKIKQLCTTTYHYV